MAERLGWADGAYVLGTQRQQAVPAGAPEVALPGLRDGRSPFSARMKAQGDQALVDELLTVGRTYVDLDQRPFYTEEV